MSFSNYNRTFSAEEQAKMDSIKNRIVGNGYKKCDYPEPVKGKYIALIDSMTLREENGRLVFRLTMSLFMGGGENTQKYLASWPGNKFPKVHFARFVTGTKNDAVCLGSVVGLLNCFAGTDEIGFDGDYSKFAETIYNFFEAVKDEYAYLIEYNPEEFYRLSVLYIYAYVDHEEDMEDMIEPTEEAIPQEEEEAPKETTPLEQKPPTLPPESNAPTTWEFPDGEPNMDLPF